VTVKLFLEYFVYFSQTLEPDMLRVFFVAGIFPFSRKTRKRLKRPKPALRLRGKSGGRDTPGIRNRSMTSGGEPTQKGERATVQLYKN
jgi:hypothetical protein